MKMKMNIFKNIKDCINCKNCIININKEFNQCLKFPINFNNNIVYNNTFMCRQNNKLCGIEAKFFVEKE